MFAFLYSINPVGEHKTIGPMLSPHKHAYWFKQSPYRFGDDKGYALNFLRITLPANPNRPKPNSIALAGSGTAGA